MARALRRPEAYALGFILAVTAYRVVLHAFNVSDLFVDEAQYWLWGQDYEWGYFSKPPLIGWWIRLVTDIAGSAEPFFVRFTAPLLHAVTALCVMALARRFWADGHVGAWAGALYISMPLIVLGGQLMTTDTLMLPMIAAGMLFYVGPAQSGKLWGAAGLGLCFGLACLAKYALFFFVGALVLAAIFIPQARLPWRCTALAVLTFLAVVAGNIWWNIENDLTTARHTLGNAGWDDAELSFDVAGEFLATQFFAMSPLVLGALFVAGWLWLRGRGAPRLGFMAMLSLPIIFLITAQGLTDRAYGNWAAAGYVTGPIAGAAVLLARRWMLWVSLGFNMLITLAVPLAFAFPQAITFPDGTPLANRYLGLQALSREIASAADAAGLETIAMQNRDLIADLFYTYRGGPYALHAVPRPGPPDNFYEQKHPLPLSREGEILLVTTSRSDACAEAFLLDEHVPAFGDKAGKSFFFWRLPPTCLTAPALL